jgi:hypothetical protein
MTNPLNSLHSTKVYPHGIQQWKLCDFDACLQLPGPISAVLVPGPVVRKMGILKVIQRVPDGVLSRSAAGGGWRWRSPPGVVQS